MSNDEWRKEQHEKLRALIAPLADALNIEPCEFEREDEEAAWEAASDLYAILSELFREELET
ncbi:MAG: hypothetical protein IJU96_01365 [Clostridia bacterium]|nr:hypothetical protein [Clostridia bacterium]